LLHATVSAGSDNAVQFLMHLSALLTDLEPLTSFLSLGFREKPRTIAGSLSANGKLITARDELILCGLERKILTAVS